jgi:hypothetical protein
MRGPPCEIVEVDSELFVILSISPNRSRYYDLYQYDTAQYPVTGRAPTRQEEKKESESTGTETPRRFGKGKITLHRHETGQYSFEASNKKGGGKTPAFAKKR